MRTVAGQGGRVAIVGAGAIGSVLAARLARTGHDVAVVARGSQLQALRACGAIELDTLEGRVVAPVEVHEDCASLRGLDAVFVCTKAHDIEAATATLCGEVLERAIIVPVINGIPWWYRAAGSPVTCVDPRGVLGARFARSRLVGAVTYIAAEAVAPGVVRNSYDGGTQFGAPDQHGSAAEEVVELFQGSGLNVSTSGSIADAIWLKLAGNVSFNPVAALTGADVASIIADAGLLDVVRRATGECMAVGSALGVRFPVSVEGRIEMARRIGNARPSMLQDLERGRQPEADALLGAVAEIGRRVGVATPTIDALYALVTARYRRTATT